MMTPTIQTYREIVPIIYSWSTPDIPKYQGWEKIGYTEQASAEKRIQQQASQLNIAKKTNWEQRALFLDVAGGHFTDHDFHSFLQSQGVEREDGAKRTEWHNFTNTPASSLDYFFRFSSGRHGTDYHVESEYYTLRPEQEAAVQQAIEAFGAGFRDVLWNAKPRFGKTLTTYDLARRLDARNVLIVTNRPAIANSWFDDYAKFIGHQTDYKFVSESSSLENRSPITRKRWTSMVLERDESPGLIEFVSLQDLKGSQYFGGPYDKLHHITELEWDLLIIDEAHEGVETAKTDIAFDQIKRKGTLHLSGTPFRAIASGKFASAQIYNWTYADEREARDEWDDESQDNPYQQLPTLNLYTYQMSRMISDRLEVGVALDEDDANIDYAFDLNQFFSTKENGMFQYEEDVLRFLNTLTTNEKYPFSTPALRDEIRHSFWLLDRVASAKALERILNKHPEFQDYEVILAAGDGRSSDADLVVTAKSYDRVRDAIARAEETGGKTITLSVGQLTTGVTIPEWTAVLMLSNIASPAQYMQAAFRAQNPCTFERNGTVYQKQNAYIFDFAPERTLTIYDSFANDLYMASDDDYETRETNIRGLLNFLPVIGEDSEGRMVALDAEQVLTFPQVFKAREVVRRGFLSNLLFANVAGIFRHPEYYTEVLEKMPKAKEGKIQQNQKIPLPEPPVDLDSDGNARVDTETVINPMVEKLGRPVWEISDIGSIDENDSINDVVKGIATVVKEKMRPTREAQREYYGLTKSQIQRDEKTTDRKLHEAIERSMTEHKITNAKLEAERRQAATESELTQVEAEIAEHDDQFHKDLLDIIVEITDNASSEVVQREETKNEQKRADDAMEDARAHLRGFSRTIPLFLMAYGKRDTILSNLDDYTPDDVFEEITGITEEEFRFLRDGRTVTEEDGTTTRIPGLFDETVFNQSIQEFLDKKEELADYFDDGAA